jgi:hypothetical protein
MFFFINVIPACTAVLYSRWLYYLQQWEATSTLTFHQTLSQAVMGKHPDLMVGPPTPTVFPTNDRNFERSQFFDKIFEKI